MVSGTVYKLPTMNSSANPIEKKEKSLPLSVEYSTDNSRLDSLINSYLHYRYSHAYLHHNDVLRRNARVHDGCNALPDYSSGFRLYNFLSTKFFINFAEDLESFKFITKK